MIIEDQGYGVYPWMHTFAKEKLRQDGKSLTEENIHKTIQKYAKENAESYTPNPELGKNPEGRVSMSLRKVMVPWLYKKDSSFLKRVKNEGGDIQAVQIEIGGAINQLTQFILKHNFGFKTTRIPKADPSNPKEITDFEYLASGPGNSLSTEERKLYNKQVDVNRQARILIQGYLSWAITPLMNIDRKNLYKIFLDLGYKEMPGSAIRKPANIKEFIFLVDKIFSVLFSQVNLNEFFKGFRWRKKEGKMKFIKQGGSHKKS